MPDNAWYLILLVLYLGFGYYLVTLANKTKELQDLTYCKRVVVRVLLMAGWLLLLFVGAFRVVAKNLFGRESRL
jgi:hypothetical protein